MIWSNNVLVSAHKMVSVDIHPEGPHIVFAALRWVLRSGVAENVLCDGHATMRRGTDIMSFIPHIPCKYPCVEFPIYTVFSASKSHFGVARVLVDDTPIATALLKLININLNCSGKQINPGIVVALPNTVISQMTLADFMGGVISFFMDGVIQFYLSSFLGKGGIDRWKEGIAFTFIGSPLGFGLNTQDGKGTVGSVGRLLSDLNNMFRGIGELIGGDCEQGAGSIADGAEGILEDGVDPLGVTQFLKHMDFHSIPLFGDAEEDLNIVKDRFTRPASEMFFDDFIPFPDRTLPTSPAFDNPDAEQF